MQGPTIVQSLYADNYNKGVAAGNAVPSTTKAIIDGLVGGIQTGQQIRANDQSISIRQNQIEQQPVENEIRQEQLEGMQQRNESNGLELQIQKDTQELETAARKAKLEEEAARLNQMNTLRKRTDQFQTAYSQAVTPQEKKQLIDSGQFQDVFAAQPKVLQQSLGPIWGTLNDQEKEAYTIGFTRRQVKDSVTDAIEKDKPAYYQAQNAWANSSLQKDIAVKTGINDPIKLAKEVDIVPTGTYLSTDGKLQKSLIGKPGENNYVRGTPDVAAKTYDVIRNGEIVAQGISKEEKDSWSTLRSKMPLHDGTILAQREAEAIANVEKAAKAQRQQQQGTPQGQQPNQQQVQGNAASFQRQGMQQQVPQAQMQQGQQQSAMQQNVQPPPGATTEAKFSADELQIASAFNLTAPQIKEMAPTINRLTKIAEDYASPARAGKSATEVELEKDTLVRQVSATIAKKEYDNTPAIRKEYTEDKVREYNASIEAQLGSAAKNREILNAFKVKSPTELYVKNRYGAIAVQFERRFDNIVNNMKKRDRVAKTAEESANEINAYFQSKR